MRNHPLAWEEVWRPISGHAHTPQIVDGSGRSPQVWCIARVQETCDHTGFDVGMTFMDHMHCVSPTAPESCFAGPGGAAEAQPTENLGERATVLDPLWHQVTEDVQQPAETPPQSLVVQPSEPETASRTNCSDEVCGPS